MALQQIFIDQPAIDKAIAEFNALLPNANAALVELETNFTVTFSTYEDWLSFVHTHPDQRPDRLKELIAQANATTFNFGTITPNIEALKKLIELPSLETLNSVMPQRYDLPTLGLGEFDQDGEIVLSDTQVATMTAGHTIKGTSEQKAAVDKFVTAVNDLRSLLPVSVRLIEKYLHFPNIEIRPEAIREIIKQY